MKFTWPMRFQRNVLVIAMYAEGKTLREMGEAVDLTHSAIIIILREVGLRCADRDHSRLVELKGVLARLEADYRRVMATLPKKKRKR